MLSFLSKQIPYNYHLKRQLLIGTILGGTVTFVMVFLQPFGTYDFESNHKYFIFSGFGVLIFATYFIWTRIENIWYNYKNKKWEVGYEIISFLLFILFASVPIHFYNQVFLNSFFNSDGNLYDYLSHGVWFFRHSIIPIMLLLLPFHVYLRNRFGTLTVADMAKEVELSGMNKGENITLKKEDILFIKASENYVNIYYTKNNTVQQVIFRNTLTAIKQQAPFLIHSHRSYLVNMAAIRVVKGNSQNAQIAFHQEDLTIPLSKSYYKTVKSDLATQPKN
ncbi:MAG: LytTR family DNA-binding domain-containing protein [Bacteroidota bacterium]